MGITFFILGSPLPLHEGQFVTQFKGECPAFLWREDCVHCRAEVPVDEKRHQFSKWVPEFCEIDLRLLQQDAKLAKLDFVDEAQLVQVNQVALELRENEGAEGSASGVHT
jgi:hypothetical protein